MFVEAAKAGIEKHRVWVGALLTTTALMVAMLTALPSARADQGTLQVAQATSTPRSFNIPAEPLSDALTVFGQQSGLQVSVDAALIRGINAPAVTGTMTSEQALGRPLTGTSFTYRIAGGNVVTLEKLPAATNGAMTLPPVRVEGQSGPPSTSVLGNVPPPYAGGQVATGGQLGMLGNKSVMDTPFNQTNYTSKLIQDQQAQTIGAVLKNDPSITSASPAGTGIEYWYIRGFSANNDDLTYGGMYGIVPYNATFAQFADRVEVLKDLMPS